MRNKHVSQKRMYKGLDTVVRVQQTFFSQEFCTENGLNLKHAKTTADLQKNAPKKKNEMHWGNSM